MLIVCIFASGVVLAQKQQKQPQKQKDLLINGHKVVDLGLPSGNLWASYNVGESDSPYKQGTVYNNYEEVEQIEWGGTWRLPTEKEFAELWEQCNVTYLCDTINKNIINAIKFTNKKDKSKYVKMRVAQTLPPNHDAPPVRPGEISTYIPPYSPMTTYFATSNSTYYVKVNNNAKSVEIVTDKNKPAGQPIFIHFVSSRIKK